VAYNVRRTRGIQRSMRHPPQMRAAAFLVRSQGRALIIANLSSASPDAAETLCTLRFASTAQTVELGKAKRNIQAITSNVGRRGSTTK